MEICLLELFQYRAFATPFRAWPLLYNLIRIQTLNKFINSTQIPLEKFLRHLFNICRQHKTVKDVIRHHQTPANDIWCQHKPPHILEHPFWVDGNVCWCCLVSVGVCCCPEVCRDTWRRCLRASEWSVSMFVGFECVYGCIGVLRPWRVQQMLFIGKAPKGKIHTCTNFEKSKYQNLPI